GTDAGLRVVLATNGTLLTPEIVEKLRAAGVQRLSISIDGATAETHDNFRG
ncbi:MAG TPA: radical SAM/SPASM domain-containing protein, partial [Methanosarcina sp.]|nr:radical SAM/SPASM domain-containing protein [Methanosarcina sp.]